MINPTDQEIAGKNDDPVQPNHDNKTTRIKGKDKHASKEERRETYLSQVVLLPQEEHSGPSALTKARTAVEYWADRYYSTRKSPRIFLMVCTVAILLIIFVLYMPNLEDATKEKF